MKEVDILCLGELTIDEIGITDKITDDESATLLTTIQKSFGGRGANFAAFASIFDSNIFLIGPVGNDFRESGYKKHMQKLGIDTSGLFESKQLLSSRAFVFNEKNKSRTFFYGGPLYYEEYEFLNHAKSAFKKLKYKAVYCTSSFQDLNKICLSSSSNALKAYSPGHEISYHSTESLKDCLHYTDILFLNENETNILEKRIGKGIDIITKDFDIDISITTFGRNGSKILSKGKEVYIPSCKPKIEVDDTGAGDSYAGAFIANYLKSGNEIYAGKIASSTASFVVEKIGCQTNIPTIEMILNRFMGEYKI